MRNPLSLATLVTAWSLVTSCVASDATYLPALETRQAVNESGPASTFFWAPNDDLSAYFSFTIRYDTNKQDIYMRLQCPDRYSWIAVGFGKQMAGSLMFVFYANTNGKDIVYSPRISSGHTEPTYFSGLTLETVEVPASDNYPPGIYDGTWNIAAKCPNYRRSLGVGSGVDAIDFTTRENMIYAYGPPDEDPHSNALDAPLRRHDGYGYFNIDLGKASVSTNGNVTVPPLGTTMENANKNGPRVNDHEPSSPLHAALMCFAFLIMFPSGVIASRVLQKVKLHAAIQGLGLLFVIIGTGVGIFMSKYYNRSKHISNGHQIFGLVILAVMMVQWAAGFVHHRHFVKTGSPLRGGLVIQMHRIVGPLVMAAGIINGAFGFRFALTRWNLVYAPLVIAIVIIMLVVVGIKTFLARKRAGPKSSGVEGLGASAGYAQPAMQPPAYPSQPAAPYNTSQPYGDPQPYTGYGGGQPYGNSNWDKSDIALQSLEPQHPKNMI